MRFPTGHANQMVHTTLTSVCGVRRTSWPGFELAQLLVLLPGCGQAQLVVSPSSSVRGESQMRPAKG